LIEIDFKNDLRKYLQEYLKNNLVLSKNETIKTLDQQIFAYLAIMKKRIKPIKRKILLSQELQQ
jgi:hypothetical protein